MTVHPDGLLSVTIGTLSAGQGHETSFAQLIGEWLGIGPDQVQIVTGDTDFVAVGGGSHSGRSMRHAATTVHRASGDIIEKAMRIASHVLEASTADLVFEAGHVCVAGSDRAMDLFAIAKVAITSHDLPEDLRGPLSASADVDSQVASFPYGCHVAEVEVDPTPAWCAWCATPRLMTWAARSIP